MTQHLTIGTLTALACLALAAPAMAAGSSTDALLFGKDPGLAPAQACFVRHYTPEHLASHPDQNVKDMMLFVNSYADSDNARQYVLEMGVDFKSVDKTFFVSGGCYSSVDGKETLGCGIDCDGGHIEVNVKDTKSMLVAIPDGARSWDPDEEDGEEPVRPEGANFGLDDKLFRLDRADLQTCLPLVYDDAMRAEISAKK